MRIAIIGNNQCWHAAELAVALERLKVDVSCIAPRRMRASIGEKPYVASCNGPSSIPLDDFDAVVVRSVPGGSLEQVIFRVDLLHRMENAGVKLINNPDCIETTVDKYYTSTLLEDHGIPTPRTVVTERFEDAMDAFRMMGDAIVKPLFGSLGLGMVRISDEDTAHRVFKAWQACRYVYYVQEYIPHGNWDIRAFVIGSRVAAAMSRSSDNWKTNINRGGIAEPYKLSPEQEELCFKTASALGAAYLGVDILVDPDGVSYVIEANSAPGWKGLQDVTDVNIASELANYVVRYARGELEYGE
ncbi:MAG: RimK family alpha-L-glutamate ligase [Syntrophaceticus sp.]|jgi:RimK family alpha-L-glutamate ligase